jgi:hypothetical protein
MISRAEIHVEMDGSKSLNDVEMVLLNTEKLIKSKMPSMDIVLVVPHEQRKKKIGDLCTLLFCAINKTG